MSEPKSFNPESDPEDMDANYLVDLAFQLYARACHMDCTQRLHERASNFVVKF